MKNANVGSVRLTIENRNTPIQELYTKVDNKAKDRLDRSEAILKINPIQPIKLKKAGILDAWVVKPKI